MATSRAHDVRRAPRTAEPAGAAASSYTQFVDPRGTEANENKPKWARISADSTQRYVDPVGTEANNNQPDSREQESLPEPRVTIGRGVAMVGVAALFDGAQASTFIFALAGTLVAAAIGWIPFIGQFLGGITLMAGAGMQTVFGILIIVPGYLTMGFWFLSRGIPVFSGRSAAMRVGMLMGTLIISAMPYLGALPDLSLWVLTMVMVTYKEDKVNTLLAELSYNRKARGRMRRRYVSTS